MLNLIKPQKLKKGDKVATVSLSWGAAGTDECKWRYFQGRERLENVFGLEVVEMPHTLASEEYVYQHPEKRAEDMMKAFSDKSIKAVICCIGGDDSIRMLPYIDFDVIRNNPKIFTGYSDSTVGHFMCMKAGLSSFYGASIFNDFAENVKMCDYTVDAINRVLFSSEPIGKVKTSETYTGQFLEWIEDNKHIQREFKPNSGYELLQGKGIAKGRLIGGCIEVIDMIRGTSLFPDVSAFDDAILFLETSEVHVPDWYVTDQLRALGAMGILNRISGIVWGKPQDGVYYEEYKAAIKNVLAEQGRTDMPVLYNASIGHNEPKFLVPYGAMAEIDIEKIEFTILESGVI